MLVIKTPDEITKIEYLNKPKIFLCGSISRGNSFRNQIIKKLDDEKCVIYDPRFLNKNTHPEEFAIMVNKWCDLHIKEAEILIFWINKTSKQQITMFELGKFSGYKDKYIIVGIEEGYPRGKDVAVQLLLMNNPRIEIKYSIDSVIEATRQCLSHIRGNQDNINNGDVALYRCTYRM